ncbi:MAG: hypothetical protein AB8I08_14115 [Sandaracinaceae bacterium]
MRSLLIPCWFAGVYACGAPPVVTPAEPAADVSAPIEEPAADRVGRELGFAVFPQGPAEWVEEGRWWFDGVRVQVRGRSVRLGRDRFAGQGWAARLDQNGERWLVVDLASGRAYEADGFAGPLTPLGEAASALRPCGFDDGPPYLFLGADGRVYETGIGRPLAPVTRTSTSFVHDCVGGAEGRRWIVSARPMHTPDGGTTWRAATEAEIEEARASELEDLRTRAETALGTSSSWIEDEVRRALHAPSAHADAPECDQPAPWLWTCGSGTYVHDGGGRRRIGPRLERPLVSPSGDTVLFGSGCRGEAEQFCLVGRDGETRPLTISFELADVRAFDGERLYALGARRDALHVVELEGGGHRELALGLRPRLVAAGTEGALALGYGPSARLLFVGPGGVDERTVPDGYDVRHVFDDTFAYATRRGGGGLIYTADGGRSWEDAPVHLGADERAPPECDREACVTERYSVRLEGSGAVTGRAVEPRALPVVRVRCERHDDGASLGPHVDTETRGERLLVTARWSYEGEARSSTGTLPAPRSGESEFYAVAHGPDTAWFDWDRGGGEPTWLVARHGGTSMTVDGGGSALFGGIDGTLVVTGSGHNAVAALRANGQRSEVVLEGERAVAAVLDDGTLVEGREGLTFDGTLRLQHGGGAPRDVPLARLGICTPDAPAPSVRFSLDIGTVVFRLHGEASLDRGLVVDVAASGAACIRALGALGVRGGRLAGDGLVCELEAARP